MQTFIELSAGLIPVLMQQEGLVGFQLGISENCKRGRTLGVWRSEEAMYDFVITPKHVAAMAVTSMLLSSSASHNWEIGGHNVPITFEQARDKLDSVDHGQTRSRFRVTSPKHCVAVCVSPPPSVGRASRACCPSWHAIVTADARLDPLPPWAGPGSSSRAHWRSSTSMSAAASPNASGRARRSKTCGTKSRDAVRQGLLASGAGHAATTAEKLMPWLDRQAHAWTQARTDACLDTQVHRTWDADLMDRSSWCLNERRLELDALLAELETADKKATTRAVQAAASLRLVEPSRDALLLSRLPAPPTSAREDIQAIRVKLSRASAMKHTGAFATGLEVAREGLEAAEALDWPPLVAAAKVAVGGLLEKMGAYEEAQSVQELAYFEAATAGALEDAFSAATQLSYIVGYHPSNHAEGERWWRHAELSGGALPDLNRPGNLGGCVTCVQR